MSSRPAISPTRIVWLPLLICLLGAGLRLLRLEWQPLWWDEGYSVYFATEALGEMLRLTAHDIHPPLYYALLHLWLVAFGSASPLLLRTFSVSIGLLSLPVIGWLARLFYPARTRLILWTLLLLAISPIHIFYSQEVRMYGLEMLLGMISTGFFWQMAQRAHRTTQTRSWLGYVAATTALLYTEYYAVLLPISQGVWALWHFRKQARRLLPLGGAWIAVALAYLPWLVYAVPKLVPYVSQKIVEDADRPLEVLAYTTRHLIAFVAGHIPPQESWLTLVPWLAFAAVLLILALRFWLAQTNPQSSRSVRQSPTPYLLWLLLLPFAVGFALNLRLPFFPMGGERVLLFVLPYLILLLAAGLDEMAQVRWAWARSGAVVLFLGLLAGAGTGVWSFYTIPRYVDDDYRPLIHQTIQQGSDTDTVLAVFPWQVGYWRAYAPVWGRGTLHGPWPLLTPSPAWGADVQSTIDSALEQGKLWFPAHLSLGGILEGAIEDYLRIGTSPPPGKTVVNFENRWYSPTTRLSGWARSGMAIGTSIVADFSAVQLHSFGLDSGPVTSANDVMTVALGWGSAPSQELRVTLRLEDEQGQVWAQRDYTPLGSWRPDGGVLGTQDQVGLLIPPAVPPGYYRLTVGVGPAADDWLYPVSGPHGLSDVAEIYSVIIDAPAEPLPILRLPMKTVLDEPVTREGIDFVGASGFDPAVVTLAGAQMNLSLFVQTWQTPSIDWDLYVSMLDSNGDGVAGWEGWPLPDHPVGSWSSGTQMRLPVSFYLPAVLTPGEYRLVAGLRNPASGEKGVPVGLGALPLVRRDVSFVSPQPQHLLEQPALFGSHATLLGYDTATSVDGTIELTLYWRVEQTLLPPHHVFVHLSDKRGTLLEQDDGLPGRNRTAAPSNTWIAGEYITDPHTLHQPTSTPSGLVAEVGLYDPISGVRLPVNSAGKMLGDTYAIPLDIP